MDLETYLNGITGSAGNYAINLTGDHTLSSGTIGLNNGVKVSLRGTGAIDASAVAPSVTPFQIHNKTALIIRGPTLKGGDGAQPLVSVNKGGSLTLHSGAITGNKNNTNNGGGVLVDEGTFTMNGGEISGNSAKGDGGGVLVSEGIFTMNGGTIIDNNASGKGGGVWVNAFNGAKFTKTGGIIYGDTDTIHTNIDNTASAGGHAVFVHFDGGSGDKERNTTAKLDINLNSDTADNWGL